MKTQERDFKECRAYDKDRIERLFTEKIKPCPRLKKVSKEKQRQQILPGLQVLSQLTFQV